MLITIAEDSALLREGIAQLLVAEGHEIIDSVGSATELIDAVSERQPQLVIVDVRMPPDFVDEGIRAALTIRSTWPQVAVMVLSQYVERRHAAELLTDAGGVGYLLKDRVSDIAAFLDAIERVGNGETVFDQEVIRQELFITQSAVEKHINSIFTKLDLPQGTTYNRRVLAILQLLQGP